MEWRIGATLVFLWLLSFVGFLNGMSNSQLTDRRSQRIRSAGRISRQGRC